MCIISDLPEIESTCNATSDTVAIAALIPEYKMAAFTSMERPDVR
jgi:hypothetical protein